MNVSSVSGANAFYQRAAAQKTQKAAQQSQTTSSAASRRRDRFDIRYGDIVKAEKEGYIEVDGKRYAVSDEMLSDMKQAYEQLSARNEGIKARLDAAQNVRLDKQQTEMAKRDGKSMQHAMEIARRISQGGRVPSEDEHYLMTFSKEMYQAAKMMADMAEEHKEYDTSFEDDELLRMEAAKILGKINEDMENDVPPPDGGASVEVSVG